MAKVQRIATQVIHARQEKDIETGAVIPPIYATSTYAHSLSNADQPYTYSRCNNPTRAALENMMAGLEAGKGALAFSSGMAAITAVLDLLAPGDHIIVHEDIYGGTWRLFEQLKHKSAGIQCDFINCTDMHAIEAAIQKNTRVIWCESLTNPMLHVLNIKQIANFARSKGIWTVVDNTFATPYLQNPLALGADIVVHSATKYLNGHSDALGGLLVANDLRILESLTFIQKTTGAVLSPFDSFLILRGIKTLALRMAAHCHGALKVAQALAHQLTVESVIYPGLSTHPHHSLATQYLSRGYGGMVSFRLKPDHAQIFLQKLRLITVAESLGGVESLIAHPNSMTHASMPEARRAHLGIDDGLIRLSVGIEDPEDIVADISQALDI